MEITAGQLAILLLKIYSAPLIILIALFLISIFPARKNKLKEKDIFNKDETIKAINEFISTLNQATLVINGELKKNN